MRLLKALSGLLAFPVILVFAVLAIVIAPVHCFQADEWIWDSYGDGKVRR